MIKLPRFAYDYASYKRNEIREMDSRNVYRPIFLMDIDSIIKKAENEFITINEYFKKGEVNEIF